jgi:hypothetical protein
LNRVPSFTTPLPVPAWKRMAGGHINFRCATELDVICRWRDNRPGYEVVATSGEFDA